MHIRTADKADAPQLLSLFKKVAEKEGGIVRHPAEISEDYEADIPMAWQNPNYEF